MADCVPDKLPNLTWSPNLPYISPISPISPLSPLYLALHDRL